MAGKLVAKHEKMFEQMLVTGALRGTDSTGAVSIKRGANHMDQALVKQVGDPFNLLNDNRYNKLYSGFSRVLLGHNRWATVGKVNRHTAHPFDFDGLVGAHNGTLDNKYQLADNQQFTVDSENLFHHIEKHGVEDAISKSRGAWALVWWDKYSQELNFIRNDKRPLSLCLDDAGVLYWASEKKHLEWMLDRNEIKHAEEVWSLKIDTLVTMSIDKEGNIGEFRTEELKGAPPLIHQATTQNTHRGGSNVTMINKESTEKQQSSTEKDGNSGAEGARVVKIGKEIDANFAVAQGVVTEYICKARDSNGMDFFILFDEKHPQHCIRLYDHSAHNMQKHREGSLVRVNIASVHTTASGVFYKASPWSIEILGDVVDADKLLEGIDVEQEECYECPNGNYMNRNAFLGLYPECNGCGSDIVPEHANQFTTQHQIMCPACVVEFNNMVSFL